MVNMIWTIACSTGFAMTLSAPASASTAPRLALSSGLAANSAATLGGRSAWAELKSDLVRWKALPADWDGDDGIAPPGTSVDAAESFIEKLKAAHIIWPEASVSGDGEIAYNWTTAKGIASVAFLADGHLVAYSKVAGHRLIEMDEPFGEGLDLVSLFESLRGLA